MKKFLKIAAALVLLLVLVVGTGVAIFFWKIDFLAKRGIQEGGSYALGVPTTVDSVSLHVFSGNLSLSGLEVANPQGFNAKHFLTLKKGEVAVTLDSLNKDTVDIPTLHLSGIDVNLERSGSGSNYDTIIKNLSRLKGSSSGSSEKKFIVHDLTIQNVAIHADMLGAPGGIGKIVNSATKVDVPIESIKLTDVGRTGTGVGGTGVTMKELSAIIVQAVLAAAAEKGYGTIPGEILNDLKSAVSSFDGLKNLPVAIVGRAGETVTMLGGTIEKIGQGAGGVVDTIGKGINDVGKGIADGIGGLLGGDKDKKDDKKTPPKKP